MGQLYSFQPYSGPHGSSSLANIYYLPPHRGDYKATLLQSTSDKVTQTGSDGVILGQGTGAPRILGGTLDVVHFITAQWLGHNDFTTYPKTVDGLQTAMKDFAQWVVDGGLGLLTDRWWNGSSWSTRWCTARFEANPMSEWAVSYSRAQITGQWFSPYGRWVESDGTTLTPFR